MSQQLMISQPLCRFVNARPPLGLSTYHERLCSIQNLARQSPRSGICPSTKRSSYKQRNMDHILQWQRCLPSGERRVILQCLPGGGRWHGVHLMTKQMQHDEDGELQSSTSTYPLLKFSAWSFSETIADFMWVFFTTLKTCIIILHNYYFCVIAQQTRNIIECMYA